jgi:hypothetical protein
LTNDGTTLTKHPLSATRTNTSQAKGHLMGVPLRDLKYSCTRFDT